MVPVIPTKPRLLFPNLSMLDLSHNKLRELPSNLHEFTNLSVSSFLILASISLIFFLVHLSNIFYS